MGAYKKFDEGLYKDNDERACNAVLNQLVEHQGLYAIRNEDRYGVDIVVFSSFKPAYYIEVEVKKVWRADQEEFPWATIQVPTRKEKFLKLGKPTDFWILREDLKKAIVIADKVLEESPRVEVPNKYNESGEYFFQIDVTQCSVVTLEE